MRLSIKQIIGIILAVFAAYAVVSNLRPVGWSDSLLGIIAGIAVFWFVMKFKGLK